MEAPSWRSARSETCVTPEESGVRGNNIENLLETGDYPSTFDMGGQRREVALRVKKKGYLVENREARPPSKARYKKRDIAAPAPGILWAAISPDTGPCDPTLFGVAWMDVVLPVFPVRRVKNMGCQPEDPVYYSHEA